MNIFYFGDSDAPLFGAYHQPAATQKRRSEGVVICSSVGHEMLKTHRALRQLASMLARAGYPVLRFDYSNTGDSSGACEQASMSRWIQDVVTASQELKEISGAQRISLIGLRLGANLAAMASMKIETMGRLVLWEPVVDGRQHMEHLLNASIASEYDQEFAQRLRHKLKSGEIIGIAGFAVSPGLREEIASQDVTCFTRAAAEQILILVGSQAENYAALQQRLQCGRPAKVDFACVEYPANWSEHDELGSQLLPQPMIQGILSWMQ